jgi:hypothetical protein
LTERFREGTEGEFRRGGTWGRRQFYEGKSKGIQGFCGDNFDRVIPIFGINIAESWRIPNFCPTKI